MGLPPLFYSSQFLISNPCAVQIQHVAERRQSNQCPRFSCQFIAAQTVAVTSSLREKALATGAGLRTQGSATTAGKVLFDPD